VPHAVTNVSPIAASVVYAAKAEERSMTRQFPSQYPDYKNRTKMLIPLLF
jgi:protein-S-isoprenylcysteine O-methyltransferase Ste14